MLNIDGLCFHAVCAQRLGKESSACIGALPVTLYYCIITDAILGPIIKSSELDFWSLIVKSQTLSCSINTETKYKLTIHNYIDG